MNQSEIARFLDSFTSLRQRTIVIVDFGNVDKWERSLGWRVGIRELSQLIKRFSTGNSNLRRFYYGSDFGPSESSLLLAPWSRTILDAAVSYGFEVVTKRVKYMHDQDGPSGFSKKCDLDVEMTIDLVGERDSYDRMILFSGDGDLVCALRYLYETYNKECFVFGARNHIGREVFDAREVGIIKGICYAEDFDYRLAMRQRLY
jgi:hypothetical protein